MTLRPTEQLAAFLSGLRLEAIPDDSLERVTDIILDTIACALAGRSAARTTNIEVLASALSDGSNSTVIAGTPSSLVGATLINGFQIAASGLRNLRRPITGYLAPEVVPPALALSEQRGASGGDLLLAVATGLETAARIATGINYGTLCARGWHPPGVIGPFGAAAASASILKLDPERYRNAISLAGTQAAGSFANADTPTMDFHQSRGGVSGLLAALLAEQEFPAGAEIFKAERGGVFDMYSDGGNPAAMLADLGKAWMLETISLRHRCDDGAIAVRAGERVDRSGRDEIVAKFRRCAEGRLDAGKTRRAIEMIVGLKGLPRVAELCAVLSDDVPSKSRN